METGRGRPEERQTKDKTKNQIEIHMREGSREAWRGRRKDRKKRCTEQNTEEHRFLVRARDEGSPANHKRITTRNL